MAIISKGDHSQLEESVSFLSSAEFSALSDTVVVLSVSSSKFWRRKKKIILSKSNNTIVSSVFILFKRINSPWCHNIHNSKTDIHLWANYEISVWWISYKAYARNIYSIADFRVTAGTPFYSWIYTLQSRDLDTFSAFDTSGANNQLINLNTMAWNHLSKK